MLASRVTGPAYAVTWDAQGMRLRWWQHGAMSDPAGSLQGGAVVTPALGAALAAHELAAVVRSAGGRVLWANDAARDLVNELGTTPLPGTLDAQLGHALRLDPSLCAGLSLDEVRTGTARIAATHALLECAVSVVGIAVAGEVAALVTFAPEPLPPTGDRHVRRLEVMLTATSDVISVVDRDGIIRYSNAAARHLTGFGGTDANGASFLDFVHPDDHGIAIAAMQQLLDGDLRDPVELRLRYADGWRHAEVLAADYVEDEAVGGFVLTVRDITDRVRRQEEAARNQRRLESIVENIDEVIVLLDRSLSVLWTSPGIERLIDAPAYTNVGEHAFNDMHPDDVDGVAQLLQTVMLTPDGRGRVNLRLRHARLGWRWVEAAAVNRLDDPAVGAIVCTLRDVTDQQSPSDELRRINQSQREVTEQLREADRVKDQFLATLSHELRTPLTSVRGFSEILLRRGEEMDPSTREELLRRIHDNAGEMEDMVQQLLDFSRVQAGRVEVRPEVLQPRQAIESLLDRLSHQLADHPVELRAGEVAVRADRRALDHVMRNLLTNAARYSPPGTAIEIAVERHGDEVWISVRDHGCGIAPEHHATIFQSFYQASPASPGRRGTGVGLNIARRYAALQGGRLWLESALGEGSTFFLSLPAADDPLRAVDESRRP